MKEISLNVNQIILTLGPLSMPNISFLPQIHRPMCNNDKSYTKDHNSVKTASRVMVLLPRVVMFQIYLRGGMLKTKVHV